MLYTVSTVRLLSVDMPTVEGCFVLCLALPDRSLNHLVKDGKPIVRECQWGWMWTLRCILLQPGQPGGAGG